MAVYNYLLNAIYPSLCQSCGQPQSPDIVICNWCKSNLPYVASTHNLLFEKLKNDMPINGAFSLLYFQKHEMTQSLLHKLKYKGQPQIGEELGRLIGAYLSERDFDALIPVPLHKKKLVKRGYNQAERICSGIAEVLKIAVREDCMIRIKNTKTQTQLTTDQRYSNLKDAFKVQPNELTNKVLLVDDVVTTGATIGACVKALKDAGVEKIWVAVVADASLS